MFHTVYCFYIPDEPVGEFFVDIGVHKHVIGADKDSDTGIPYPQGDTYTNNPINPVYTPASKENSNQSGGSYQYIIPMIFRIGNYQQVIPLFTYPAGIYP